MLFYCLDRRLIDPSIIYQLFDIRECARMALPNDRNRCKCIQYGSESMHKHAHALIRLRRIRTSSTCASRAHADAGNSIFYDDDGGGGVRAVRRAGRGRSIDFKLLMNKSVRTTNYIGDRFSATATMTGLHNPSTYIYSLIGNLLEIYASGLDIRQCERMMCENQARASADCVPPGCMHVACCA